jgi:hypothetical protein
MPRREPRKNSGRKIQPNVSLEEIENSGLFAGEGATTGENRLEIVLVKRLFRIF